MHMEVTAATITDFIGDIFKRRGAEEYLGEPVTMAEHMYQAAHFAEQASEPDEIVVAALLHDIGHFIGELGSFSMQDTSDRFHEEAGAKLLENFFPATISDCVKYHVAAKRYLCAVEPAYFAELSKASVHSLNLQGGPMNKQEAVDFSLQAHLEAIVKVRRFDDRAKVAGMTTQHWDHYAPLVQRIASAHQSQSTMS